MRRELEYFTIGDLYGGRQDYLDDWVMRIGGCAAVTACDACIYFARQGRRKLYPFDPWELTWADYLRFSRQMKPYLHPRMQGIDRLELYQEGLGAYLRDVGERGLGMEGLPGSRPYAQAEAAVRAQIDGGFPIPTLVLRHKSPNLQDYVWHWFLLTGYETFGDVTMVKAVTYGAWRWLDLSELWDTGWEKRGGLILFHPEN